MQPGWATWSANRTAAALSARPVAVLMGGRSGERDVSLTSGRAVVAALRQAAGRLPGPLGRYSAPLAVLGVHGTLWRCEVSTTHSYLLFEAAGHEDVLIDVSFKQFLVMPEWMEPRHFDACQEHRLFAAQPDAFVGTHAELEALMTEPGLAQTMRSVYERAGDATHDAPFADAGELRRMHTLRNLVLFAVHDVALRRRLCGRPSQ